MRFMNAWDIDNACERWASHPQLGPAARTLRNLAGWANRNSDGWAYWPKPARAARKLMELLDGDYTNEYRRQLPYTVTAADVRKAYVPIKAFRTRVGADFVIEEV